MNTRGLLKSSELTELVESGKIKTVIVAFIDHYGRLMGKRFEAEFFLQSGISDGTHACDYLLTTDMEMEPVKGYRFANWELGYGDFHLLPDLESLRRVSWLKKTAIVLCKVISQSTHHPVQVAPKSILDKQINRCSEHEFTCFAASELEYFVFQETYREAFKKGYNELEPVGWYLEDYNIQQGTRMEYFTAQARKHLKKSGIPVENSKGEWGLGQHELNVRYTEVGEMADRHVLYKQCLKELAEKNNLSVSFMAKPHDDQAGSSCHIHMSLWDKNQNVFYGDSDFCGVKCSDHFKWFLGGWIHHALDVMPFYAPTINSYKRFSDGSWAPTRLAWSNDNRTAGFRVVGEGQSLRIECRIPGADCNPYLAFAASLASGLSGIENHIVPPEAFEGDIYAAKHLPRVPHTLEEAVGQFSSSPFCKEAFGPEVVEHYTHFYQTEIESFQTAVTDWERKRYFERI